MAVNNELLITTELMIPGLVGERRKRRRREGEKTREYGSEYELIFTTELK